MMSRPEAAETYAPATGRPPVVEHRRWTAARHAILAAVARPGWVALVGVPGIGKTLLLEQVAEDLIDAGHDVILLPGAGPVGTRSRGARPDGPPLSVVLIDAGGTDLSAEISALAKTQVACVIACLPALAGELVSRCRDLTIVELDVLDREGAAALLAAELGRGHHPPDLLAPDAVAALSRHSAGVPRSLLAHARLAVFLARLEEAPRVTAAHVDMAAALTEESHGGAEELGGDAGLEEPDWAEQAWGDPEDASLEGIGPQDIGPQDIGPQDIGPEDVDSEDIGPQDIGPWQGGPWQGGPWEGGPWEGGPEDSGPDGAPDLVAGRRLSASQAPQPAARGPHRARLTAAGLALLACVGTGSWLAFPARDGQDSARIPPVKTTALAPAGLAPPVAVAPVAPVPAPPPVRPAAAPPVLLRPPAAIGPPVVIRPVEPGGPSIVAAPLPPVPATATGSQPAALLPHVGAPAVAAPAPPAETAHRAPAGSPQQGPERAPASGALALVARPGDTLSSLYQKVYRGRNAPPLADVVVLNRTPIEAGQIVVFPTPPAGWYAP